METRKKTYNKPLLQSEAFVPNEYVAACSQSLTQITVTCARPGTYGNQINDGTSYGNDFEASIEGTCNGSPTCSLISHDAQTYYHGICGDPSTLYLDGSGNGLENNGQDIYGTKVGGISDGSFSATLKGSTSLRNLKANTTYEAIWYSNDKQGHTYKHWGALKVIGTPANFS